MENWLITEMMIEQRRAAANRVNPHEAMARDEHRGGLRRALAATLVRAGLRLDGDAARDFALRGARDARPEVTT